jgi:PAS domain S-box-containing protein
MTNKADDLRKRAEELLKLRKEQIQEKLLKRNKDEILQELQIYQIELEIQNEELLNSQVDLELSRKKYRDLFEKAPNPYLVLNKNFVILNCNQTFADCLGYSKSQLENTRFSTYIHPQDQDMFYLKCRDLIHAPTELKIELRLKNVHKQYSYYRVHALPEENEKELKIRLSLFDINKEKEAEQKIQQIHEEIASQNEELHAQNEELQTQNEEIKSNHEQLILLNKQVNIEKNIAEKYLHVAGVMFIALDKKGIVALANQKASEILGFPINEICGKNLFDYFIDPKEKNRVKNIFEAIIRGDLENVEFVENYVINKKGEKRLIAWHNTLLRDDDGNITGTLSSGNDITEKKKAEEGLKKIEWLLNPKSRKTDTSYSDYGDLTILNKERTILDSLGKDILEDIVSDYLGLLDTSAAVYEKNGDYATGIFSSQWCRLLDGTSRHLCKHGDNAKALKSGQWLCHESCWTEASKKAIESGKEMDIECHGGLHIYALPVFANNEVIGAINFGYGDPPTDENTLREISKKYGLSPEKLQSTAREYESRPQFIIEIAKERLTASARLIGEIVERKQYEKALKESEQKHQKQIQNLLEGFYIATPEGILLEYNKEFTRILNLDEEKNHTGTRLPDFWQFPEERKKYLAQLQEQGFVKNYEIQAKRADGEKIYLITNARLIQDENKKNPRIEGSLLDITDRKKTELALKQKEWETSEMLNSMLNAFVLFESVFDQKGKFISYRFLYINKAYERITGVRLDEVKGKTVHEVWPDTEPEWIEHYGKTACSGKSQIFELYHDPTQKLYHCEVYRPFETKERFCVIFEDITAQKEAEKKIQREQDKFRMLFNNMATGSCLDELIYKNGKAIDYRILDINPAFERILGVKRRDTVGKLASEVYGSKDIPFFKTYVQVAETGIPVSFEAYFPPAQKFLHIIASCPSKGQFSTIITDISERKTIEEKLKSNYELLHIAGETARFGGWDVDLEKNISNWSDAVADIHEMPHGYVPSVEEGINFYAPEWREKITQLVNDCAQKGIPYNEEMEIITSKGKRLWIRTIGVAIKDENGKIIKLHGSFQDISERKEAEEKLKEMHVRLELAMQSANMAWWEMDITTGHVIFEKRKAEMLGYDPENFTHYTDFVSLLHPDDKKKAMDAMQKHLDASLEKYEVEYRILNKSGEYTWFYDIGAIVKRNSKGKALNVCGLVMDISERKEAEKALRESEEKYRTLVDSTLQGVIIAQADPIRLVFSNPAMTQISGYSSEKLLEMGADALTKLIFEEDRQRFFSNFQKRIQGENIPQTNEYRLKTKNGTIKWVALYSSRIEYQNKPATLTTFMDISERKQAEEALRETQAKFRQIFEGSRDGFVMVNIHGAIIDANDAFCNMLGYSLNELKNIDNFYAITPEKWQEWEEKEIWNNRLLKYHYSGIYEKEYIRKNGSIFPVELQSYAVTDNEGQIQYLWGVARDISKQKKALQDLQESESRFRQIYENASIGIARVSLDFLIQDANEAYCQILGYSKEELTGKHIKDITAPEVLPENIKKMEQLASGTIKHFRMKKIFLHKDGSFPTCILDANLIRTHDGKPAFFLGSIVDISKRKAIEEAIKASEKKFRSYIENAPMGVFIANEKGEYCEVNSTASKITGYTEKELLNKKVPDLLYHTDVEKGIEHFIEVQKKGFASAAFAFLFLNKNGEKRFWKIDAVKLSETRFLGFVEDITEKQRNEIELKKYREKLEERVKERTEELAAMNEELTSMNEELLSTNEELAEKNEELEKFNKLFIHREFRINELKEKIRDMENRLKNFK